MADLRRPVGLRLLRGEGDPVALLLDGEHRAGQVAEPASNLLHATAQPAQRSSDDRVGQLLGHVLAPLAPEEVGDPGPAAAPAHRILGVEDERGLAIAPRRDHDHVLPRQHPGGQRLELVLAVREALAQDGIGELERIRHAASSVTHLA